MQRAVQALRLLRLGDADPDGPVQHLRDQEGEREGPGAGGQQGDGLPAEQPEAAYFPSTLYTEGKPFEAGARHILQRRLAAAAELGFTVNLGIETEFFVLKDGENGPDEVSERDVAVKPCYDLTTTPDNVGWLTELVEAIDELGWDVYSVDHEDARGQSRSTSTTPTRSPAPTG